MVTLFDWLTNDNEIAIEDKLREDLGIDSLGMVNLQVTIEDNLNIRFDPIENDLTEVFDTVGSLASFVDEYLARCQ